MKTHALSLRHRGRRRSIGILHLQNPDGTPSDRTEATTDEILQHLRNTYCGRIAFEFNAVPVRAHTFWYGQ